jgi:transcriptional regulator with XRE-family HTH domain
MDNSATSNNFYDHIRELCEKIAPQNGVHGPAAKGTGIAGAEEITGIPMLSQIYRGYEFTYEDAEKLLRTAFPDDEAAQNHYREMTRYPEPPAELVLERIAKDLGLPEPLPPLKEFFAAGLRISQKKADEFSTKKAPDLLGGRTVCYKKAADSLLEEMGFGGLNEGFVAEASKEIQFYAKRKTEIGAAIYAMRHFPKAVSFSEEITFPDIATKIGKSISAVSSYTNRKIPPRETVHDLIAFFQREIGNLVVTTRGLEAPPSGAWDEGDFYKIAEKMAKLYPEHCKKPERTTAEADVIEWGNCLDALIKVLGILEKNLVTDTGVTQTTINSYRRADTVSGPNHAAKKALQEALGCESDDQFLGTVNKPVFL